MNDRTENQIKLSEANRLEILFGDAVRRLPEVPCEEVLAFFSRDAHAVSDIRSLWLKGKQLQREFDIPARAEEEIAAGLWSLFREAIIKAREEEQNQAGSAAG